MMAHMAENHFDGRLRAARNTLIPLVPDLVLALADDPQAIRNAIAHQVAAGPQGTDPTRVLEADYNKTERHTIAGYFINCIRTDLVRGEGRDAQLAYFEDLRGRADILPLVRTFGQGVGWRATGLSLRTRRTMARSAATVREQAGGYDEDSLWSLAAERYVSLGQRAVELAAASPRRRNRSVIPQEGRTLWAGITSGALSNVAGVLTTIIGVYVRPRDEQLQATQDIVPIVGMLAGTHFDEFRNLSIYGLIKGIVKNQETGTYKIVYRRDRQGRLAIPHFDDLMNAQLKCPAHAQPVPVPEVEGASPKRQETSLVTLARAVFNKAAETGYIGPRL